MYAFEATTSADQAHIVDSASPPELPEIRLRYVSGWWSDNKIPEGRFMSPFRPYRLVQARQLQDMWTDVDVDRTQAVRALKAEIETYIANRLRYTGLLKEIHAVDDTDGHWAKLNIQCSSLYHKIWQQYKVLLAKSKKLGY